MREEKRTEKSLEEKQRGLREEIKKQYTYYRKLKKYTQQDIADAAGVKRPSITRFESGDYNPTLDMLVKVADAMNMEVEIILKEKNRGDEGYAE